MTLAGPEGKLSRIEMRKINGGNVASVSCQCTDNLGRVWSVAASNCLTSCFSACAASSPGGRMKSCH